MRKAAYLSTRIRTGSRGPNRLTIQTGDIWNKAPRTRPKIVRRVCQLLEQAYGRPDFGNPKNPVDDLIYIISSNRTTPQLAKATYSCLRMAFPSWEALVGASDEFLKSLMQPAGLSDVKSKQIKAALGQIMADFGTCDLTQLKKRSKKKIENYLTSLPGVSTKVAKCVMMYTMGAEVLPVDAHVHRIAKRLGWTRRRRADQCHAELEALIVPRLRYIFHVDCIAHGRQICRPQKPACAECHIRDYCDNFVGKS